MHITASMVQNSFWLISRINGICSIAVGIITLVTGVAAGVLMIVSGSRLLKRKSDILI